MKHIGKFAVLGAVLTASAMFAHADTIVAASYGSTSGYLPPTVLDTAGSSAVQFGGAETFSSVAQMQAAPVPTPTSSFPSDTPGTAYDLNPGTTWAKALPGSAWIGFAANAGPGGTDPQYGYYKFTTTLTGAITGGLLNIMADDTTEVFLNNSSTPFVSLGTLGSDSHCADTVPTCLMTDSVAFSAAAGSTLTFIVEQAGITGQTPNLDPSGLDFNITTTPEPSSLMLLGTGLMGAAGMMFRRKTV